ncbi:RTA1 like protein-domain-containing protein [Mycena galericulata]|nr:RTA1 like protein-domain-containing protein [Mycena galericulata]
MTARHISQSLVLFAVVASVLAADASSETKPPVGGFIPKKIPAIIALALYALSALVHWIHFFRFGRHPFMLTLTLGMTAMATGFVMRIVFSKSPYSLGLYIIMDLFILLSPCLFLATDYVLLARLTTTFDEEVRSCLLIRPSRIVRFFVWSDVTTFLLQSSGGGLTTQNNPSTVNIGNKIVLIGLGLQAASFSLFTLLLLVFGWRVQARFPEVWRPTPGKKPFTLFGRDQVGDWRILYWTMCVTCIGILIRSIFRIAEFAGGYNGFLATHEGFFYCLDSLPLWIAMSLYAFVWPARFLFSRAQTEGMELQKEARA